MSRCCIVDPIMPSISTVLIRMTGNGTMIDLRTKQDAFRLYPFYCWSDFPFNIEVSLQLIVLYEHSWLKVVLMANICQEEMDYTDWFVFLSKTCLDPLVTKKRLHDGKIFDLQLSNKSIFFKVNAKIGLRFFQIT